MAPTLRNLIMVMVAFGSARATCAQVVAADEARVDRLLRGLTATAFEVRRQSESELRELGVTVLPRLRDVSATSDLEVRRRVQRIIADVERRATEAALERLESGGAPRDDGLLHGWDRFRDQLGNDPESRELYGRLLRAEPSLMRAVDESAELLQSEFESRCADLGLWRGGRRRATPGLATVAALLFVGGQPECRPSAVAANCINTVVQQGDFRAQLNRNDPPVHLQMLLGQWIARSESANAMQRLSLAATFELDEGLDVAREMIHARALGAQIQYAVLYIAKVGGPQELHVLEELLQDDMPIPVPRRGNESTFSSRLQDVALAGLLHLTGQHLRDYGFEEVRSHPTYLYTPGSVGFSDDDARDSAMRQWKEWAAANLRELNSDPVWAIEGQPA